MASRSSLAALVLFGLAAAGCGKYGQSLRTREVVAVFAPGASAAQHLAARAACSGVPNAVPEPLGTGRLASERLNNVRFRVDNASDAQLSQLYACLTRQPGVIGVNTVEPGPG